MAQCFPFGQGPFGQGAFGGCDDVVVHPDCGFGFGPFGEGPFGLGCASKYLVTGLKVVAAYDGPQMVLAWTAPTKPDGVTRLRILRKEREYPKAVDDADAVLVYDVSAAVDVAKAKFADTTKNTDKLGADPTPGVWHYYRIFTNFGDGGAFVGFDSAGGSEGFDYCYDGSAFGLDHAFPDFDRHVWETLLPDSWGMEDGGTSQKTLSTYTHTTDERVVLTNSSEPEGFTQRFVRLWNLLALRTHSLARTVKDTWDAWNVRKDALPYLARILGVRDDRREPNRVRRDLLDAAEVHRGKGGYKLMQSMAWQIVGGPSPPPSLVEMHTRLHRAWDPSDPDADPSPGLWLGGAAEGLDSETDTNTSAWSTDIDCAYHERGLRLYVAFKLDPDVRSELLDMIRRTKPATVTVELWEQGVFIARETS